MTISTASALKAKPQELASLIEDLGTLGVTLKTHEEYMSYRELPRVVTEYRHFQGKRAELLMDTDGSTEFWVWKKAYVQLVPLEAALHTPERAKHRPEDGPEPF